MTCGVAPTRNKPVSPFVSALPLLEIADLDYHDARCKVPPGVSPPRPPR